MRLRCQRFFTALLCLGLAAAPLSAQPNASRVGTDNAATASVMTRTPDGRVSVRVSRITERVTLDGTLSEAVYGRVAPFTGFVQQEPNEGAPATEKTEAWIFFDDENIYVAARLYESEPSRRVMSDMRRDAPNMYQNDHLAVIFDTFNDHRNGFGFSTNRIGGLFDFSATNEQPSSNWNALWTAKAQDFDGGWTVEIKIPFRSIRFAGGAETWGVNMRRMVRWKNETSFLSGVPRAWGRRALNKVSDAAVMTGIETPKGGLNIDVKPYALGSILTNRTATPAIRNARDGNFGLDAKWGITPQVVADLTYNTDFAQVEDDEAQVNLTRFSLFFPEKREFFLEGQDAFAFAGVGGGGGFGTPGASPNDNLTPTLFYSRRIGLTNSGPAPIIGGGRVLGRAGPWQVGALSMQTDDVLATKAPSTNFSVVRVNRDILSRSRLGLIATQRDPAGAIGRHLAVGADAQLNLRTDLAIIGYVARTTRDSLQRDPTSYRARMDWNGDRYGMNVERMSVGDGFDPQVGFLRRSGFQRSYALARFSPRPAHVPHVRKFTLQGSADHITSMTGTLQSEDFRSYIGTEFANGDIISAEVAQVFEQLVVPFGVAKGVTVPVGGYRFNQAKASYNLGPQHRISGGITISHGGFYGGTLTETSWRGRVELSPQFYIEPTLSRNHVDGPYGRGDANLVSTRVTYTVTPRMFMAALVQYQSRTSSMSTNLRMRWEYQPGSEFFLVYSDGRTTIGPNYPELENRSIVVKFTKLLRW